jgi:hypothetical protein
MKVVHAKLNSGLYWQKQQSTIIIHFYHKTVLKFKEESSKLHNKDSYGAEIWALRQVNTQYLESFEM